MAIDVEDVSAGSPVSARRAYLEVVGVFAAFFLASVALALIYLDGRSDSSLDDASWAVYGPATLNDLARAGLAAVVIVLVAARRGITRADLGLVLRRDEHGRLRVWPELRLASLALLALFVGSAVTWLTATGTAHFVPVSAAGLVYGSAHSVEAGVMEEAIVLGFLVAMLRRAGRPTGEIVAVAVVLRVSYHLYYGLGVLGIAVWAAVFVWLFWRTRSLLPLVAVHVWWDLVITLGRRWPAIEVIAGLLCLVLFVVAPVTWLIERVGRVSPLAWPGWYPDPGSELQLRWWDGRAWSLHTVAVAAHGLADWSPVPRASSGARKAGGGGAVCSAGRRGKAGGGQRRPGSGAEWAADSAGAWQRHRAAGYARPGERRGRCIVARP